MYKTQGYLSTTTYNYTELWVSLAASLQIKEEDREVLYDPTNYLYLQCIYWLHGSTATEMLQHGDVTNQ